MNFTVQWHEQLDSTNTWLIGELARNPGLPSGTVIAASRQTRGRGRHQRVWISPAGENLTFSLWLKGSFEPQHLPSASMAVAVAVAQLLETCGMTPTLKWPNDVLVNGRKICGILSEGVAGGVIIGTGLNVNLSDTACIDQPATSILIETGKRHERSGLLDRLLQTMSGRLDAWSRAGFAGFRQAWETRIPSLGQPVAVCDGDTVHRGILTGFGDDGELLLRGASGTITVVWAGEIPTEQNVTSRV